MVATLVNILVIILVIVFAKEAAEASDWYDKISKY